jgi:ribosome biogenesis protein NSA1
LHSTSTSPPEAGQQVEKKGEVLTKIYTKSIPTVVVWDGNSGLHVNKDDSKMDDEDESIWDTLRNAGDSDEEGRSRRVRSTMVQPPI